MSHRMFCRSLVIVLLIILNAPRFEVARVAAHSPKAASLASKGRALLVGINQYQSPQISRVLGAEEDVWATRQFIQTKYGFTEAEIHTLTGSQATRARILAEFRDWLVGDTLPGDRVFFLYSGHGSTVPDDNGDEEDGRDETIVPYDTQLLPNRTENQIRDDEFNALIEQLSGRLSVLVFDSCHSGTVTRAVGETTPPEQLGARYLPPPEEGRAGTGARRVGGGTKPSQGTGQGTAAPPDEATARRNLRLVEAKVANVSTGTIVISAAQANQVAYPFKVEGGYRGALSYLFVTAQAQGNPTFAELRQQITAGILALQQQKLLPGKQVPAFEVLSQIPLENVPLFAATKMETVVPTVVFANPKSALKVTLRSLENKTRYRLGEKISYQLTTSAPGWLYLLVFSQQNQATCVFPNSTTAEDRQNQVVAGTHRLPRTQFFFAQEPEGKDVVIALLSSVPLPLGDQENLTWDEVFNRLRSKRLSGYVKTRGVGTKQPNPAAAAAVALDDADWQAASLVIETVR